MAQWEKIVQYELLEQAWKAWADQGFPIQIRRIRKIELEDSFK